MTTLLFILHPSALLLLFGANFPRGPGLYFNPFKVALVFAIYLAWIRTCWWVDHDCKEVGLPTSRWNPLLLFSGFLGLLLVWGLPVFAGGVGALLLLYLAPTLVYVSQRNRRVDDADKVLTSYHLKKLASRYLGLKLTDGPTGEKKRSLPVRFISKSPDGREDDSTRVERAQESQHYRSALELVFEAVQVRTTDIHLEPTKDEMTVRFRIDGIMQAARPFDRDEGDAVLNIFKVLSNMDITEKRKPQDGRFTAEINAGVDGGEAVMRLVDFRVATSGSVTGEKMVMRLLDRSQAINNLGSLGMRDRLRDQISAVVTQPHGMFIVCGPTGSGKSTTLYACMSEIDRYQKNVITVENPVEYHIENVTQIEVNPKAGKTFASELRSILRQDPDVIYIGEIRDQETAEIACQAAQTGHMVFTTLHANDTITAILRLIDLGVQPFMVGTALSAILGQRLVRRLCPKCKVPYRPNPEMLRRANLPVDKIKAFYRPPKVDEEDRDEEEEETGNKCTNCGGTGYRGRTGIYELLVLNEKIRDLIKENPNMEAIRQEAAKSGMLYLQQDGMRVVIEGETSIEELLRVSK